MTLKREQLEQIARKHGGFIGSEPGHQLWVASEVLAAMQEAVALAVEQCAQICEEVGDDYFCGCADAIRAKMGKK